MAVNFVSFFFFLSYCITEHWILIHYSSFGFHFIWEWSFIFYFWLHDFASVSWYVYFLCMQGGCLKGQFMDATPFSNSVNKADDNTSFESSSLVDELGPMLTSYGFNYHGVEVLYSGVFGVEMTCEIFIGPVYYQRLRHMVSDKFQVCG